MRLGQLTLSVVGYADEQLILGGIVGDILDAGVDLTQHEFVVAHILPGDASGSGKGREICGCIKGSAMLHTPFCDFVCEKPGASLQHNYPVYAKG